MQWKRFTEEQIALSLRQGRIGLQAAASYGYHGGRVGEGGVASGHEDGCIPNTVCFEARPIWLAPTIERLIHG
jgi:hypothetical protein